MKKSILFVLVVLLGSYCYSQNTRNVETPKPQSRVVKKEKKVFFDFFKKKKTDPFRSTKDEEVAAFRKRMKKISKKKAKEAKLAKKPEYSDPSYFGHKRPPKKRAVGKQKFCTVCKIKH